MRVDPPFHAAYLRATYVWGSNPSLRSAMISRMRAGASSVEVLPTPRTCWKTSPSAAANRST